MEAVILYNPESGREQGSKIAAYLANHIRDDFNKIQIIRTKSSQDAEDLSTYYTDKGIHSLFVVGGDGTIGTAIKGIQRSENENKPILGAIPGGTLNGISKILGFPNSTYRAIRSLDITQTQWLDYATSNGNPFMMIYSIGDIPESIHSTDPEDKANFALLAYFHNIARHALENNHHSLTLDIDGEIFRGVYSHIGIITSNALDRFTPPTMNFDKNDGKLHVFMVGESNFLDKMILVPDLLMGKIIDNEHMVYRVAENVKITSNRSDIATDLDGDRQDPVPSDIQIYPNGIQMYVCK